MSAKSQFLLSLAIMLGAASAAAAAPKHPAHHHQARVERHLPRSDYQSFGSAQLPGGQSLGSARLPADYFGDPYNHQEIKCWGGTCNPEWGMYSGND